MLALSVENQTDPLPGYGIVHRNVYNQIPCVIPLHPPLQAHCVYCIVDNPSCIENLKLDDRLPISVRAPLGLSELNVEVIPRPYEVEREHYKPNQAQQCKKQLTFFHDISLLGDSRGTRQQEGLKIIPQRLKPTLIPAHFGTIKIVPFQRCFMSLTADALPGEVLRSPDQEDYS